MVLNFTNDLNEIKSALTDCADDFFNQSYNNPKDIERFSQKFSQKFSKNIPILFWRIIMLLSFMISTAARCSLVWG